jgi:hypothetical protein
MANDLWRGVAIAEGFTSGDVIAESHTVRTKKEVLEGEEGLGEFNFHFIEVPDAQIDQIVETATKTLKPSWYIHLVKDGRMIVAFEDKSFTIAKDDADAIAAVKDYAITHGVHPEQIELERLFDNPYDD